MNCNKTKTAEAQQWKEKVYKPKSTISFYLGFASDHHVKR